MARARRTAVAVAPPICSNTSWRWSTRVNTSAGCLVTLRGVRLLGRAICGVEMARDEGAGGGRRNLLQMVFGAVLGVFSSLIAVTRGWVGHRSTRKSVKLTVGGDALEQKSAKPEDQEKLISESCGSKQGPGARSGTRSAVVACTGRCCRAGTWVASASDRATPPRRALPGSYDDLVRARSPNWLSRVGCCSIRRPDATRPDGTSRGAPDPDARARRGTSRTPPWSANPN